MNIRKITALAGSLLMTGLTITTAAAAAFPAPFVKNGTGDVAVVYGASSADRAASTNVQSALAGYATGGSVTVDGGEAFKLEKSSNKLNFAEALNAVYSTLGDEEMTFLVDGTYDDGNIDEEFTQSISLGTTTSLDLFKDSNYNSNEPTVGFLFTDGAKVLSYTIDFDNSILYNDMNGTDMPLLGREFYVYSAETDKITLLDTAEKNILALGETATIAGKTVKVDYITSGKVKFTVDGVTTTTINEGEKYKLADGSYIIPTDVMSSSKDSVTDSVEFSIGKGEIILENTKEVKINGDSVKGLVATMTNDSSTKLDSLTLTWNSHKKTYLTEDDSITMPGFETIQMIYGGLNYPTESEKIALENGETLTLSMGNYDLPVMWKNSTAAYLGEEGNPLVLTTALYNSTLKTLDPTGNITVLNLIEDDKFLVTNIDTDLSDITTLYYEVSNLDYEDQSDFEITLTDLIGSKDLTFTSFRSRDVGEITVELVNATTTNAYLKFTTTQGAISYNTAVSEKGMVVTIPTNLTNIGTDGVDFTFREADKNEDVNLGKSFNVTVKNSSNDKLHAASVATTNVALKKSASDKTYLGMVKSDLASKIYTDESGDEYDFEIEYFGKEVVADVQVVVGGEITSSDSLGNVMITDSEVANSNANNLVIVGGSCINAAAATVLGGAYCGAAFTEATSVDAGEFMIKGYENSAIDGKFALVVAGYEAADTTNAVTYLVNKRPDTSKAWVGTTATEQAVEVTSN